MRQVWLTAHPGGTPAEVSQDEVKAMLAHSPEEVAQAGDSKRVFWTRGMWRWELRSQAAGFLGYLEQSKPPEKVSDNMMGSSVKDRIKHFPRLVWTEFHPRAIWAGVKDFLGGKSKHGAENEWKSRIGWLILLQYVPLIASIINRGWRIDLMRSGATGSLPDQHNAGRHLSEGVLLWGMYLAYLMPQFILLALTEFKWIEHIIGLAWYFIQSTPTSSLESVIGGGILNFALETVVMMMYPMLAWPYYRIAMIRYALEGDIRVFGELRTNHRMTKASFDTLAALYLTQKTVWGIYFFLSMLAAMTGFGIWLIPALSPLRNLTSGVVYLRGLKQASAMKGFSPMDDKPLGEEQELVHRDEALEAMELFELRPPEDPKG